jgi:GntR family transcriptional regulator/MocR family aminotransferase
MIRSHPLGGKLHIHEEDAGLHFLLKVETRLPDSALTAALRAEGIRFPALSEFYHDDKEDLHTLVVNYSGLREETMERALDALHKLMDSTETLS